MGVGMMPMGGMGMGMGMGGMGMNPMMTGMGMQGMCCLRLDSAEMTLLISVNRRRRLPRQ